MTFHFPVENSKFKLINLQTNPFEKSLTQNNLCNKLLDKANERVNYTSITSLNLQCSMSCTCQFSFTLSWPTINVTHSTLCWIFYIFKFFLQIVNFTHKPGRKKKLLWRKKSGVMWYLCCLAGQFLENFSLKPQEHVYNFFILLKWLLVFYFLYIFHFVL